MKSVTLFRDPVPNGQSYPIGLEAIGSVVPDQRLAMYFISLATWIRQAYPPVILS